MIVGIPKEIKNNENRVGLTPQGVKELITNGHDVFIEKNAGINAGFSDQEYLIAGAKILSTLEEIYFNSDIVIKVKEPQEVEIPLIKPNHIIYTYLHLAADKSLTLKLLKTKATFIAYETVQLKNGSLPLLAPMSEIAGKISATLGMYFLSSPQKGKGLFLSGVTGTKRGKVVILGAGIAGQGALKVIYSLGCQVIILDKNIEKLKYINDLYHNQVETLYSNESNIQNSIQNSDLIIGTVLIPGNKTPKLIKKDDLCLLEKGSVLVDISIDQGGCFETSKPTTHENPIYSVNGITHYCVTNIPGAYPKSSTIALTNATFNYLKSICNLGLKEAIKKYPELETGVNLHNGHCTYRIISSLFDLEFFDLKSIL
nr:alanine dehydrogenase [uncultured Cetobacterium sp.]